MNRYLTQFRLQFEKRVIDVFGHVTFGSTGACTLDVPNSKGILSITRNNTGLYTFVFGTNSVLPKDTYVKLLSIAHVFSNATAPAAPQMYVVANSIATAGTASIQVQFANAGTATDPGSGEQLYIDFCFGDSTAP